MERGWELFTTEKLSFARNHMDDHPGATVDMIVKDAVHWYNSGGHYTWQDDPNNEDPNVGQWMPKTADDDYTNRIIVIKSQNGY